MKNVLIFIIQVYWWVIPASKRRKCLFRESCSRYVFRHTKTEGLWAGLKALRQRIKQCRSGSHLLLTEEGHALILCDGTVLPPEEVSPSLLYGA